MIDTNIIYNESCMETMGRWPDGVIDCVVTSPPYYGQRSYGTEPVVWGADPECKHKWSKVVTKRPNAAGGKDSGKVDQTRAHFVDYNKRETISESCAKCDGWRGELGQEPNVFMYIRNLGIVFTECYRVLKKTGTLFVNIDDTNCPTGGDYKNGSKGKTSSIGDMKVEDRTPTAGRYLRKMANEKLGLKPTSLMAIPALFQVMMIYDLGYVNRSVPIWWKRSSQPSSAKTTFTCDYEPIFFFTKVPSNKYYFETQYERAKGDAMPKARNPTMVHEDSERAVPVNRAGDRDDGMRIMRTVMDINTANGDDRGVQHYAAYPLSLAERFIRAGCPPKVCSQCGSPVSKTETRVWTCKCPASTVTEPGIVYDPFAGTGTTAIVAHRLGASFVGSELQPEYHKGLTERTEAELSRGRLF